MRLTFSKLIIITSHGSEIIPKRAVFTSGASWEVIVDSTSNTGSYVWNQLPDVNSSLCKVRISDEADGSPFDVSDNNFTIFNNNSEEITVTAPNGGEIWEAGTNQNITWNSTSVANVMIEYTTNNGVVWNTIATSTPSDGFYNWSGYQNTVLDTLLIEAMKTTHDNEARQAIYAEVAALIREEMLIVPIRDYVNLVVARSNLQGLRFSPQGWFPYLIDLRHSP